MNASRHPLDYHSLVRWVVILCHARLQEDRAKSRTLLRVKTKKNEKKNFVFVRKEDCI